MSKATTAERALNRKGGTMSRLIKTLFGFYPGAFAPRRRRRGALRHHQLHRRDLPAERPANYWRIVAVGRLGSRAAQDRAARDHPRLHLRRRRPVLALLEPRHGYRHAGLAREAARDDVQPHAGPADPLLRHAPARRYHEPLHQRHRHAASDDQPVAAQPAHDDHHHRHGVLYHAVLQRVDVLGHHRRRRLYDLYDQAARIQLRALLHCAADRAWRGRGPYRGGHERPEGRQGVLPRVCRRGRF